MDCKKESRESVLSALFVDDDDDDDVGDDKEEEAEENINGLIWEKQK